MGEPAVQRTLPVQPFYYVRDGYWVSTRDITPEQWLELIEGELGKIRPHLHGIPWFRRPEELYDLSSEMIRYMPAEGKPPLCYHVCPVQHWPARPSTTRHILLDRNGRWWEFASATAFDRVERSEFYISPRMRLLDREALLALLTEDRESQQPQVVLGYKLAYFPTNLVLELVRHRTDLLRQAQEVQSSFPGIFGGVFARVRPD